MIEVEALSKTYKGKRRSKVHALSDVSFTCNPGEVFGLIGPNGAGKTTCLRILSTALYPTSGNARVMGHDILAAPREVRRLIGFLSSRTVLQLLLDS